MMPRPVQCDDDRCDDDNGRWVHAPGCPAGADAGPWGGDAAMDAAREDGYPRPFIPAQRDGRAAA